ncbi:hypothetical protein [Streptomyces sp. SAI-090]|uniref:hypothetical protein n=1 Tax=Streptomyces sp. SAI-090 TaxID=2940545 RepID=UPI0024760B1D|nr:hypothetical protein [Streptomyces sp. SAI-090]
MRFVDAAAAELLRAARDAQTGQRTFGNLLATYRALVAEITGEPPLRVARKGIDRAGLIRDCRELAICIRANAWNYVGLEKIFARQAAEQNVERQSPHPAPSHLGRRRTVRRQAAPGTTANRATPDPDEAGLARQALQPGAPAELLAKAIQGILQPGWLPLLPVNDLAAAVRCITTTNVTKVLQRIDNQLEEPPPDVQRIDGLRNPPRPQPGIGGPHPNGL